MRDVADTFNAFYNTVDVHINGDAEPEKPDTEAPSAPSGLIANNVTSTGVQLTWKESMDNVGIYHYEIQRAISGGEFAAIEKLFDFDAHADMFEEFIQKVEANDAIGAELVVELIHLLQANKEGSVSS
ncbi:hypothetical protein [Rothia uropygialis]|uniref:hypothetical protein n=1 Tax=Kocuria sp. 36 TaxID=1415402 RepID=UPI00101C9B3D|nr:hypothetical protein [Kocuria sp. 36]